MKLRTFYKKLAEVKNKFRWNFGIKDKSYCIRATPRSKSYCGIRESCPIEAIFLEQDDNMFTAAWDLGKAYNIESYIHIMDAADHDFPDLTYKEKRIRTRMMEILKGTS